MSPKSLHAYTVGSGSPLMLMHGGMGWDHTYLRPWLDPIGEHATLIYYDHLGNGHSPEPADWDEVSHSTWADGADSLRAQLGHPKMVLFGHSYGGILALEYARRYGHRLQGLILCATTYAMDDPAPMLARAQACSTPAQFHALVNTLSQPVPSDAVFADVAQTILPIYFNRPKQIDLEALASGMTYRASAFNRAMFHCFPQYDCYQHLAEITVPTLILTGKHDWLAPLEHGESLLKGLPDAEMHVFEESGHFPFIEEQADVLAVVSKWLHQTIASSP